MDKGDRLRKYLQEHPNQTGKWGFATQNGEIVMSEDVKKFIEAGKKKSGMYQSEPTQLARECWALFCKGLPLRGIGAKVGRTGEGVRQILIRYYPDEYQMQKDDNSVKKLLQSAVMCALCGKEFVPRKGTRLFCSRQCANESRRKYVYPDWVQGRGISRRNFTKEEWALINRMRTRWYYHSHKEEQRKYRREYMKRTKDRQRLYQQRVIERQVYGHAITPLPGGSKNKGATKI